MLNEAEIYVSIINPLVMKKYATAHIRKGKTDKIDAIKICKFGIDNWFNLMKYVPKIEVYEELNLLGRQYSHYIKLKIESKQTLTNLIDRTMPKIKTLLASSNAVYPTKDKLSDFIEKYVHYDNINCMSEKDFIKSYQEWTKEKGYHKCESKARKIYELSQMSIPTLPSKSLSTKILVSEAIRVLK